LRNGNTSWPDDIRPAFKEEQAMTQSKEKTLESPALLAVHLVPDAKQLLSIEEIARALLLHLEGQVHSFRHRYAEEDMHQQVQLETVHETESGQKFRVVTEYHEAFTIVDLVHNSTAH
jgi:hypothetical protein